MTAEMVTGSVTTVPSDGVGEPMAGRAAPPPPPPPPPPEVGPTGVIVGSVAPGRPGSSDRMAGSSTLVTVAWFETVDTPSGTKPRVVSKDTTWVVRPATVPRLTLRLVSPAVLPVPTEQAVVVTEPTTRLVSASGVSATTTPLTGWSPRLVTAIS